MDASPKHQVPFERNDIKRPGNNFANVSNANQTDLSMCNTEMKEKKATDIIAGLLMDATEYS